MYTEGSSEGISMAQKQTHHLPPKVAMFQVRIPVQVDLNLFSLNFVCFHSHFTPSKPNPERLGVQEETVHGYHLSTIKRITENVLESRLGIGSLLTRDATPKIGNTNKFSSDINTIKNSSHFGKKLAIFLFYFKGQCHEIFECWFFHQLAPPGPLRGTLGQFQFLPKFAEIFEFEIVSTV